MKNTTLYSNTKIAAALVAASMAASGCGAKSEPAEVEPVPGRFDLTVVSPAELKANYNGDIILSGAGFEQGSLVLIDGVPVSAIPGASMSIVDENTIKVRLTYGGAGTELDAGDYGIQVELGPDRTSVQPVHVRPILSKLEHVRTLPGYFNRQGGFLDMWVQPTDSDDLFMGLGHELTGAAGLGDGAFRWENVRFTRVGTADPAATPDLAGVANVKFEPVGTEKPLAIALTIDQSGSMIGLGSNPVPSDPNDERINQSQAFVDRINAMDQVKVLRFNGEAGAVVQVSPFSSDKVALKAALDGLRTTEGGNTPLYDAMIRSVNDVAALPDTTTRAVVLLTDGRDTTSTATAAQAITTARNAGIPIFAIGLGNPNDANSLDKAAMQNIADQTGGRVFFAEDATALAGIFDQLTALLKDSYKLESAMSFTPALPAAGTYKLEGDLICDVDGESIVIPMPAFNVSVLN